MLHYSIFQCKVLVTSTFWIITYYPICIASQIKFEEMHRDLSRRKVGSFKLSQFILLKFNLELCQVMLQATLPGSIPLICRLWRVRASWATYWIKAGSSTSSSAATETVIGAESSKITATLLSALGLTFFVCCCGVTWKMGWVNQFLAHLPSAGH